jgi:hypothetical protein
MRVGPVKPREQAEPLSYAILAVKLPRQLRENGYLDVWIGVPQPSATLQTARKNKISISGAGGAA